MKNLESPLTLDEFLDLLEQLVGVILFISLLGVDTWKAGRKKAKWIPQHALVLSALTIQIMGWLNAESSLLHEILDDEEHPLNGDVLKNNLFMVHVSRIMLCVLVAYMLPGMARPGYGDSWGTLAALGLSIFARILSDLFSVYRRMAHSPGLPVIYHYFFWPPTEKISQYSFIVSNVIISISLVWLLLLLGCAIIANKSIQDIVAQKIPTILAHQCDPTAQDSLQAVENQVLKSWIVSRACYPESIIARSVLTASAAVAVTVCNLLSILGWLVQGPDIYVLPGAKCWFQFITAILEVIFIIVVWAIIGWRCLTCVAFFGRWQSSRRDESWRKYLRVEDFWTRYILKLQEKESNKEKTDEVDERVNAMIGTEGIEIWFLQRFLGTFLRSVFWMQFSVVYFSKGCWLIAELVLDNRSMHILFSKLLPRQDEAVEKEFSEYKALLENVDLLWEAPRTLFVSNQDSIKQAEELVKQGREDGRNYTNLIKFLRKYRKLTGSCKDPAKLVKNQTGLKFLGKGDPVPALDVERYFIYARKQPWKLTAVSLINIIIRLSSSVRKDALEAYSEACQLMGLVDDSEPDTDSLLNKAADRLFKTLLKQTGANVRDAENIEDAAARIKKLADESEMKATVFEDGRDSLDWEKAVAGNAVYKLCKSIDCSLAAGDLNELVNELQSALADIIHSCIKKVGEALLDDCTKWAQDFQERKLLKAVYFAGANTALMDELSKKI